MVKIMVEIVRTDSSKRTHFYYGKNQILKVPHILDNVTIFKYVFFAEKISSELPRISMRGSIAEKNDILYITLYQIKDRTKHLYFYMKDEKVFHKLDGQIVELL